MLVLAVITKVLVDIVAVPIASNTYEFGFQSSRVVRLSHGFADADSGHTKKNGGCDESCDH